MIKKIISLLGVCMPLSSALAQDTLFVSPIGAGELFTREAPGNIEDISYKLSSVAGARHNVVVYFKGGLYELKENYSVYINSLVNIAIRNAVTEEQMETKGEKN